MLTSTLRWCCVVMLMGGLAGCSGGSAPSAPEPPAAAGPPAPPLGPPPAPSATGAAASDVPAWAGQRSDEPFDVKAFLATRAAPPDNAAPLYQAAFASISSDIGGATVAPLEKLIGELANIDKLAAGSVPAQQIDQVLAQAAPALVQIDAAQAKPKCVFVTGLTVDALLPHAQAARTVSRLSLLQLGGAKKRGDFAAAEAAVGRSLRLSRDLQPRGFFVCQLVSIAMDGMILSGIERLILTDPRLTAEQCDRLIAKLMEHQQKLLNHPQEGLRVEYIVSRNSLVDLETGRLTYDQLYDFLGTSSDKSERSAFQGPPLFVWEVEVEGCNRLYDLAIAATDRAPFGPVDLSEFNNELAQRKAAIEKFKALVAATPPAEKPKLRDQAPSFLCFTWIAPIEASFQAHRRVAAQLAGTQALLSLRRYEIAHGSLPADLRTAASDSALKTVPLDPYDGAPLRFALVAGKPTVYSVGKDLKDDGGQADWKFGQQPGDYLFVLPPKTP